jgi:DNA ligase 1
MHAKMYGGQDVTGWLMSEKLDGVRAMWDGSGFLSRTGNVFNAPEWFKAALPSIKLDGELFVARGFTAPKTSGIVRKKSPIDSEWKRVSLRVFELPDHPLPFAGRLDKASKILAGNPVASVVEHMPCTMETLIRFHAEIVAGGGEAVMLKRPDCRYTPGRSDNHLKYLGYDNQDTS